VATFPRTEADIVALADQMIAGLTANPDIFPAPLTDPRELADLRAAFWQARDKATDAEVAAKEATLEKRAALKRLVLAMKSDLRDAENKTRRDNTKLSLIGWGAPRPIQRLEAPGQALNLNILHEGPDWIGLQWSQPKDGGKVASYSVMRCRRGAHKGTITGAALLPSILLEDQERGVEWQYWVVAVNRAGKGPESNRVYAVL
jgi:hypothetical protein